MLCFAFFLCANGHGQEKRTKNGRGSSMNGKESKKDLLGCMPTKKKGEEQGKEGLGVVVMHACSQ